MKTQRMRHEQRMQKERRQRSMKRWSASDVETENFIRKRRDGKKWNTNLCGSLSNRRYLIVPMQRSAKCCAHPFQ